MFDKGAFNFMVVMTIVGLGTVFTVATAILAAVLVLPWCLWTHDFSMLVNAVGIGGLVGLIVFCLLCVRSGRPW